MGILNREVKPNGIFDQRANSLAALDAQKAELLARQFTSAVSSATLRRLTSPKVIASALAVAGIVATGGIAALSARASEGSVMISPLPAAESGCNDHPYRKPYLNYNHTDITVPLPQPTDPDVIVKLIDTSSRRAAEAPLDKAVEVGAVKIIDTGEGGKKLEVHDYLPGFIDGKRVVSADVQIVPEQEYTIAIEYKGPSRLYVSDPIKTNRCTP